MVFHILFVCICVHMLSLGLFLLLMLNPVALFLYLKPMMDDYGFRDYANVVWKAAVIA